MSAEATELRRMIRMGEVEELLAVSRMTLYRWVNAGKFPAPVVLGEHRVAFYEDEVLAWQKQRDAASPRRPLQVQSEPIKRRAAPRRVRR